MQSIHVINLIQICLFSLSSFIVATVAYPPFIRFVKQYKLTKQIREEGLSGGVATLFRALHLHKAGTPTMGGAVIIFAVIVTVLLSRLLAFFGVLDHSLLNRGETYLPIFTLAAAGVLGMVDDYLNIRESGKHKGLPAKVKMWSLLAFGVVGAWWFFFKLGWSSVHVPGVGDFDLGLLYIPLFLFVIVGTANAVNLTDGLDGLCGGLLAISYLVFAVIAYFFGLPILATFCMVVVGALVGFLWFNVPPASIYMGDTGSLALGATLGVIAMMTNALFILMIVGAIFILETISVILQLFWKKHFGRKLFLIAPIHHHFEAKGWSETKITMRFWILGMGAGIIGVLVGLLGMGEFGIL